MKYWISFFGVLILFTSCEDVIEVQLEDGPTQLVVDGWITDQAGPQEIRLTRSAPYFDNNSTPPVLGAEVFITGSNGTIYNFLDTDDDGTYVWNPSDTIPLGKMGLSYTLTVRADGEEYQAVSDINRVPPIDSIFYEYREEELGQPEGYYAEVYARDFTGAGDTYWIRAYKNGILLNKPQELNIVFDAAFSEGGNFDGKIFIRPIREGINRSPDTGDDAVDDDDVPPWALGDSVFVEIYSINREAFDFLNEVRIQTDRSGGVAELFAEPISNVRTNIVNTNPNSAISAVGFFGASAVSGLGTRIIED